MSWTPTEVASPGQLAGEAADMFSLNEQIGGNLQWLKDYKMNLPRFWINSFVVLDYEYLFSVLNAVEITFSAYVYGGFSGKIEVEVGPAGGAKSVIAVVGSEGVTAGGTADTVDFTIPPNYTFKLKKTGNIVLFGDQYLYVIWGV